MTNIEYIEHLVQEGETENTPEDPPEDQVWNGPQLSQYFVRLTTSAQRHIWRLKERGLESGESQSEYDRALVVYSIGHALWGQRFLWDQEQLQAALKGMVGEVKMDGVPFNGKRCEERWRDIVTVLAGRYA